MAAAAPGLLTGATDPNGLPLNAALVTGPTNGNWSSTPTARSPTRRTPATTDPIVSPSTSPTDSSPRHPSRIHWASMCRPRLGTPWSRRSRVWRADPASPSTCQPTARRAFIAGNPVASFPAVPSQSSGGSALTSSVANGAAASPSQSPPVPVAPTTIDVSVVGPGVSAPVNPPAIQVTAAPAGPPAPTSALATAIPLDTFDEALASSVIISDEGDAASQSTGLDGLVISIADPSESGAVASSAQRPALAATATSSLQRRSSRPAG
jgi:hypothetical protein